MKDFVAMDRINYRKGMLVYLADMKNLEHCYPLVWKYFEEGKFSVQKTPIPGVGIGCDHAGEQVNCEDKSRGGLKGITKNENARIRHYLVAPVLEQISEELRQKAGATKATKMRHHQLKDPVIELQGQRVQSLISILQNCELSLGSDENSTIKNLVTGKVFPKETCDEIVRSEEIGKAKYREIIEERLRPGSAVKAFESVKKVQLKTFKRSSMNTTLKTNDREIQLGDDASIWRKIAIISASREIDRHSIIGDNELSVTPRSLMDSKRNLYNGGQGKSKLIEVIQS